MLSESDNPALEAAENETQSLRYQVENLKEEQRRLLAWHRHFQVENENLKAWYRYVQTENESLKAQIYQWQQSEQSLMANLESEQSRANALTITLATQSNDLATLQAKFSDLQIEKERGVRGAPKCVGGDTYTAHSMTVHQGDVYHSKLTMKQPLVLDAEQKRLLAEKTKLEVVVSLLSICPEKCSKVAEILSSHYLPAVFKTPVTF